jgi:hypothetical protein
VIPLAPNQLWWNAEKRYGYRVAKIVDGIAYFNRFTDFDSVTKFCGVSMDATKAERELNELAVLVTDPEHAAQLAKGATR